MKQFEPGDRLINGDDLNSVVTDLTALISTAVKGAKGDKGDTGNTGVAGTAAADVVLQDQATGALVLGHALPTSDPAVANALWNDLGVLRVSAG